MFCNGELVKICLVIDFIIRPIGVVTLVSLIMLYDVGTPTIHTIAIALPLPLSIDCSRVFKHHAHRAAARSSEKEMEEIISQHQHRLHSHPPTRRGAASSASVTRPGREHKM